MEEVLKMLEIKLTTAITRTNVTLMEQSAGITRVNNLLNMTIEELKLQQNVRIFFLVNFNYEFK